MYKEFAEKLKAFDTIIIHRHKNPDGDAIGSQVGLKHIITANWPEKKVYMVGDEAGRYAFMDDSVMDEVPDEAYADALAVVLDCGGENMVCDERYKTAKANARMDHHMFTGNFTQTEVIDSSFESCCGILADMVRTLGLKIDPLGAKSLFTGMVTDSGRFRYDCVNGRTFELAAFLFDRGEIDFNDLYRKMYAEDFEGLKRRSEFILKIKFSEHNVAYIYTDAAEVERLGMSTFSISRGMVGVMGDIRGVDIWVNFTEAPEGVLCELRSSKYNINPIAVKYGGGGHEKASGATVASKEIAMQMLEDLDRMMTEA
ncbi:MAG: bifunctional oligoribonuclease/PAP phosphatase NrnA [Lachnospiraceae bacterium]|nr:bifunctional oligoribonuclease/PAP phosphatase NrnA [Lachnospiraceae bacterium]MBP5250280.1 bifunctional oligoribonuclease/PAP phosphatase NrnA [Lachnospiraceae bacterium]